jgi:hypothetical protein
MPTSKPRISITVEESDLAILDRFSAASRTPRASVIAQMIASVTPELERAAGMMEAAAASGPLLLAKMRKDLKEATDEATGAELKAAYEAYRLMIRKVSHRVEYGPQSEGKGAPGGGALRERGGAVRSAPMRRPGPPPTNRGVKT